MVDTVDVVGGVVTKVSVSMPRSVAQAVRDTAGPGGVSGYITAAVERQLALDRLAEAVADIEADLGGPIPEELMEEARALWHAE